MERRRPEVAVPREPAGGAAPSLPPLAPPGGLPSDAAALRSRGEAPPVAELAAAVRALPPAIAAARPGLDGAPLTLGFGRALDVDLRSVPTGVEVVLRPEGRLAAAAAAELPRVVEALRVRGVAVARAEVAPRGSGGRRPR